MPPTYLVVGNYSSELTQPGQLSTAFDRVEHERFDDVRYRGTNVGPTTALRPVTRPTRRRHRARRLFASTTRTFRFVVDTQPPQLVAGHALHLGLGNPVVAAAERLAQQGERRIGLLFLEWFATSHAFERSVDAVGTIFDNAMPSITYLAEIQGTLRTFTVEAIDLVERRMKTIAEHTASAFDCEVELVYVGNFPPTINHAADHAPPLPRLTMDGRIALAGDADPVRSSLAAVAHDAGALVLVAVFLVRGSAEAGRRKVRSNADLRHSATYKARRIAAHLLEADWKQNPRPPETNFQLYL